MGKREIAQRRRKQQETRNNLVVFIIIAAFAVVVAGMVILTQYKPVGAVVVPERAKPSQADGLSMGNPDAKVKVTEFADFQCPACASFWSQMEPSLIQDYIETGKIFYTYVPFSFLGTGQAWDESSKAAEAAYCANEQGKFWEYHDIIFANHNGENQGAYSKNRLIAFAKNIELDLSEFKECFASGRYTQQVADDAAFASEQGATYTPSFLIDGKILNAGEIIQAIEDGLAK